MSLKYAFTTSSCPDYSLEQLIGAAERFEYDGVEARVAWDHAHGIEPDATGDQRIAIRRTFEKTSVKLCCISTGCRYTDPQALEQQIGQTHRCIDLAGDLSCPLIRVFGGALDGQDRESAAARVLEAINAVIDHAADRGVTILIETHDDWSASEDVLSLVHAMDHSNFGVLWDVAHPVIRAGESIVDAHDNLMHVMRHVHIHDANVIDGKFDWKPIGQGQFDIRQVIKLLLREAFAGYVSGEWINWADPADVHLPRELATLKRYEEELLA